MEKLIWSNQSCGCDQNMPVDKDRFPNNRKISVSITENGIPSSWDGLNLRFNDDECWMANYHEGSSTSNRTLRGSGSGCDNY